MVAKKTAGGTAEKAVGKAVGKAGATKTATAAKKTATAAKKAAATVGKTAAKTAATVTEKADAKKTAVARKATTAGKNATADEATAARAPAEKATARKATAKTAAAEGAAQAAKKTGVRTVVAKKSTGTTRKTATAATSGLPKKRVTPAAEPGGLAVRPGEDPWAPEEVTEARAGLEAEVLRLRTELDASETAITDLMRDSGDGAGDDQADTGTKNITRESELALAANATSMLEQSERALERLEAGTYGLCENCGQPIGKARMQAFPRATLCVDCKQKQERRH